MKIIRNLVLKKKNLKRIQIRQKILIIQKQEIIMMTIERRIMGIIIILKMMVT